MLGLLTMSAGAQTIPTWDATSTNSIVGPTATAFKDSFVYAMATIAPYAITVGLVLLVVAFLRGLGHGKR